MRVPRRQYECVAGMRVPRRQYECVAGMRVGTPTPGCEYPLAWLAGTRTEVVALALMWWHSHRTMRPCHTSGVAFTYG